MRLDWLSEAPWLDRERIAVYPRIVAALLVLTTAAWLATGEGLLDRAGTPVGSDFVTFYAASSLALVGEPAAAYDFTLLRTAEIAAIGDNGIPHTYWYYPPMFLLLALPLGLLPYGWALAAWLGATFAGYIGVLRRIAPGREALWLAAAFPAVFVNVGHGQNGFLSAALLGGALLLLDRRPVAAGVLIGALTYKPHLGLLLPLVLAAGGHWRAFAAAAVSALAFVLATLALFGARTWSAFFAVTPAAGAVLERGGVGWHKMQSAFAAVRLIGGGAEAAYAVHAAVAVAAAAAVLWVWRRSTDLGLRGAAVAAGTLLATPLVYDYEFVVLALAIAWLGREGLRTGFLPWEKSGLVAAWLLPLVARPVGGAVALPLAPFVVAALLVLIVRRVGLAAGVAWTDGPAKPVDTGG